MAAVKRVCVVCGDEFYGQRDGLYCSPKCKQKAYYHRNKAAEKHKKKDK